MLGLMVFGAPAEPALASHSPFVVNTPTEPATPPIPADGTCDQDLITADDQCTLREAIHEANAHPGHDLITFTVSTVTLSLENVSGEEDGNLTGDLDITDPLTIDGGSGVRVLQDANDRVFEVPEDGDVVIMDSLIIESGSAPDNGGGILSLGDLTLTGTAVTGNAATTSGGGIFNAVGGVVTVTASLLANNNATSEGGGLYNAGALNSIQSDYSGNDAGEDGGGLFNDDGFAVVEGGSLVTNTALGGGGIFNQNLDDGSLTLDSVNIGAADGMGNAAMWGGGIYNNGFLVMTDGTVRGNTADSNGGGMLAAISEENPCISTCAVSATGTVFEANSAGSSGGGISASPGAELSSAGSFFGTDVQILDNLSGGDGGGFFGNFGSPGPDSDVTITAGLIEGNRAQQNGGGFALQGGRADLTDNLVTGNAAGVPTATADTETNDAYGGGYYFSGGNVVVTGGAVVANEALLGEGGGIWNQAQLVLGHNQVDGNVAAEGGGIYNGSTSNITASAVSVTNNVARGTPETNDTQGPRSQGEGGGIWNDALLSMELSEISGNVAGSGTDLEGRGGEGGGLYNVGGPMPETTGTEDFEDSFFCEITPLEGEGRGVCLTEVTVTANIAEGVPDEQQPGTEAVGSGKGGGIWNGRTETMVGLVALDRAQLVENEAALGGGLYGVQAISVTTETAFIDNGYDGPPTGTAGGGAYIAGAAEGYEFTSLFMASTFTGNNAGFGAGAYYGEAGENEILWSTFNDNAADFEGGGIWNDQALFVENSTLSSNFAGEAGGGLFNAGGQVSSTANTIYENTAGEEGEGEPEGDVGGNVHDVIPDTVAYRMTIVAHGSPQNCNEEGDHEDAGYNLDDDGTCFSEEEVDQGETGTIVGQDPRLEELDDNGGATQNHALERGSPALDAVDEGCPPPDVDQRGEERPADDRTGTDDEAERCDIGSFEHQEGEPFPETDNDGGGGGGGGGPDPDESPSPSPSPSPTDDDDDDDGDDQDVPAACRNAPESANVIVGTGGDDQIRGTGARDVICALGGDDVVRGLGGGDLIVGGGGNDEVHGARGADQVRGGGGNDSLFGGRGYDSLQGQRGQDDLHGNRSPDEILGGRGDDVLRGGQGNDFLNGGPDRDRCRGDAGADDLSGCEGGNSTSRQPGAIPNVLRP